MPNEYFSDRELGPRPRTVETISEAPWRGIAAYINSLISRHAFGEQFPLQCSDGAGPYGTDEDLLIAALNSEVENIAETDRRGYRSHVLRLDTVPETLQVLDLVQFCYENVAKPVEGGWHDFFRHTHLSFEPECGRQEFYEKINLIFARNGIVYQLTTSGTIERLAPAVLRETLRTRDFATGDRLLDSMLEGAVAKFLSPDPAVRKESLEKLWDAWERLKTLDGADKKHSISKLLLKASPEGTFRQVLEEEAKALTKIGNSFRIRHSETSQISLEKSEHVDYLFHRMFAMIQTLLASRQDSPRPQRTALRGRF